MNSFLVSPVGLFFAFFLQWSVYWALSSIWMLYLSNKYIGFVEGTRDNKTSRNLLIFLFPECVADKWTRANYTYIISHYIIHNSSLLVSLKLTLYNFIDATKLWVLINQIVFWLTCHKSAYIQNNNNPSLKQLYIFTLWNGARTQ